MVTESAHSPYCSKCRARRFKAAHPLKYAFGKLRNRAKERGKEFTLTFEEYHKFAVDSGYAELKGRTKHSLSIHRIDDARGYHIDNIGAVSVSLNNRLRYANVPEWIKEKVMAADHAKEIRDAFAHMDEPNSTGGGRRALLI